MKTNFSILVFLLLFPLVMRVNAQAYEHNNQRNDEPKKDYNNETPERRRDKSYNIEKTADEIIDRLKKLEQTYSYKLRSREKEDIHYQIDEIMKLVDRLYPPKEVEILIRPISEPNFRELMNAVSSEPFDKNKRQVIATSSEFNFFMTDQVVSLAALFSFDEGKIEVIKILYPKILDRDKNYLLYKCVTFPRSKQDLEDFIGNYKRDHEEKR
jgi:hypothetical protein